MNYINFIYWNCAGWRNKCKRIIATTGSWSLNWFMNFIYWNFCSYEKKYQEIGCKSRDLVQVEWVMTSFRYYDNSDFIVTLIIGNIHLYLIQLWWSSFQIFVMATKCILKLRRYCPWKTLSSHLNTGQMSTYNATGMNSTHISHPTRHETTSSKPLMALEHFTNKIKFTENSFACRVSCHPASP